MAGPQYVSVPGGGTDNHRDLQQIWTENWLVKPLCWYEAWLQLCEPSQRSVCQFWLYLTCRRMADSLSLPKILNSFSKRKCISLMNGYRMSKNELLLARRASAVWFPNAFIVFQNIIKLLSSEKYFILSKHAWESSDAAGGGRSK